MTERVGRVILDVESFFGLLDKLAGGHHADMLDFIYDNVEEILLAGDIATVGRFCTVFAERFERYSKSVHLSVLTVTLPWANQLVAERAAIRDKLVASGAIVHDL